MESDIDKVDLIFISGNDWLDTMYHIKELYNKDISKYILISGHSVNKDRNESEAMKFMKKGVEIGFNNINSILFVCKIFHTRRVLMTAQKHFPKDIKYSFYPVNEFNSQ
jgi:vancomycin permeability regulator SanA